MVNSNLQMVNLTLDLDLGAEFGHNMIDFAIAVLSEFDPCLGFAFEIGYGERAGKVKLHSWTEPCLRSMKYRFKTGSRLGQD